MRKLFLFFILCSGFFANAQYETNRVIITIDNSQKYVYEATLNRLRADSYKREVADGIRNHADRYFTELQKLVDYFNGIEDKHKPLLKTEIDKLTVYGNDILDLLNDLEKNELTATKLKYTVEKAYSQLGSVSEKESFKELATYKALSDIKKDVLSDTTDKVLLIMVQELSGIDKDIILKEYDLNYSSVPFRQYLMDRYEKAFILKNKYAN